MKLEFWSDIVCPWCGLAEHRLSQALGQFEHRAAVEIVHRSFQTHPDLDRNGISQRALLAMHGIDPKAGEVILGPIERMAAEEGLLPYHAIDRTLGPTDYAHALLAFATDSGVTDAWPRMFRAHFGEGRNFWSIDQAVAFAAELGLDSALAREALETGKYRSKVEGDHRDAQRLGATGVPFIVIDGRHVIRGACSSADLLEALRRLWVEKGQPVEFQSGAAGPACAVNDA